jgi:hypothetical protein
MVRPGFELWIVLMDAASRNMWICGVEKGLRRRHEVDLREQHHREQREKGEEFS